MPSKSEDLGKYVKYNTLIVTDRPRTRRSFKKQRKKLTGKEHLEATQKMRTDILNNKQMFRKFKVNDYFFQNLEDFENKFFKKNERLSLTDTPLPPQFQGVEKFGSSSDEMSVLSSLSPSVCKTIQKNKEVLTKVYQHRDNTYINGFLKLKPIEKPASFMEKRDIVTPPLMSISNNQPILNVKKNFVRLKVRK